uniref:Ubiquitin carboxyl-terminal hydrolase n=1 Tax=Parastrongyloides trichosuri TaxID=131310 RepID=A0A0N5A1H7_PARTI
MTVEPPEEIDGINIPTLKELDLMYQNCFVNEEKETYFKYSLDILTLYVKKMSINARNAFKEKDYERAQKSASKAVICIKEAFCDKNGDVKEEFLEILNDAESVMEELRELSIHYHGLETSSSKESISVEEFFKEIMGENQILVIDYRRKKSESLYFEGRVNVIVIELVIYSLTIGFSCFDIRSNKDRSIDWTKFSYIISMGTDNNNSVIEKIVKDCLTKLNESYNNTLNILYLEGGFERFKECYPDYVKKDINLSKFMYKNVIRSFEPIVSHKKTETYIEIQNVSVKEKSSSDENREKNSKLMNGNNNNKESSVKLNEENGHLKRKLSLSDKSLKLFDSSISPLNRNIAKKMKLFEDSIQQEYFNSLNNIRKQSVDGGIVIGMSGLKNLGNTCFMNSVIQALFHLPGIHPLFTYKNAKMILDNKSNHPPQEKLMIAFSAFMDLFWGGRYSIIVPEYFLKIFGKIVDPRFDNRSQHDAQEFQLYLIDALHESMATTSPGKYFGQNYSSNNITKDFNEFKKKTKELSDSRINSLLSLKTISTVKCSVCNYQSVTFDCSSQLSIGLPVVSFLGTSLFKCLEKHYSSEALSDGWKCPMCNEVRKASRCQKIMEFPEVLIIHLKRFEYSNGSSSKNEVNVYFELCDFDMSPFTHQESGINYKVLYDLYAVVSHSGNLNSGHYTSHVKLDNEWIYCNDSRVSYEFDTTKVKSKNAYILYYVLKR